MHIDIENIATGTKLLQFSCNPKNYPKATSSTIMITKPIITPQVPV